MKAMLDDEVIFNEETFVLEIKSPQRSIIQRSAAGLDGQVSIDLGLRSRKLVQRGELRAKSKTELQKRIDEISELLDGDAHILRCPDGKIFENLLIEDFHNGSFVSGGANISCQYDIAYIQQVC